MRFLYFGNFFAILSLDGRIQIENAKNRLLAHLPLDLFIIRLRELIVHAFVLACHLAFFLSLIRRAVFSEGLV